MAPDSPVLQAFSRGILPPPVGRETYGKLRDISFFYISVNTLSACFYIFVMYFQLPSGSSRRELSSGIHQKTLIPIPLIFIYTIRPRRAKKVGTLLAK